MFFVYISEKEGNYETAIKLHSPPTLTYARVGVMDACVCVHIYIYICVCRRDSFVYYLFTMLRSRRRPKLYTVKYIHTYTHMSEDGIEKFKVKT